MSEFFLQYGIFLAKTLTVVLAIGLLMIVIASVAQRKRAQQDGHIEVKDLNEKYKSMYEAIEEMVIEEEILEQQIKQETKKEKAEAKARKKAAKKGQLTETTEKRIYVIEFDGDLSASATACLREEVTAVLSIARPELDEVVLKLESPGGMVHAYGFAASQLERIRNKQIPLTICVDQVAASGGYMMACIGTKIVAAPFAIIGSIGVIAQLPNFHRLLQKNDIDFEMHTAGEYKRTLTIFGENTDKARQKFTEELEDTHGLFKDFVKQHRPQVAIDGVATGEIWYGQKALELQLIDAVMTSDEYITAAIDAAQVYQVSYELKKGIQERIGELAADSSDRLLMRWWHRVMRRPLV